MLKRYRRQRPYVQDGWEGPSLTWKDAAPTRPPSNDMLKAEICDADHIIHRIVSFQYFGSWGLKCGYGEAFSNWAVPAVLSC